MLTVRSKHENNNVCARAQARAARRRAREGEHAELQARMRWHASRVWHRQRCAPRLLAVKTTQNPSSHTHKKKWHYRACDARQSGSEWAQQQQAGGIHWHRTDLLGEGTRRTCKSYTRRHTPRGEESASEERIKMKVGTLARRTLVLAIH